MPRFANQPFWCLVPPVLESIMSFMSESENLEPLLSPAERDAVRQVVFFHCDKICVAGIPIEA